MARYLVIGRPVIVRSASTAGPSIPPHVDQRVTIEGGSLLPEDVPLADLNRLLQAGRVRLVTK